MRRFIGTLLIVPALAAAQVRPTYATVAHEVDSLARAFVAAGSTPSVAISVTRGGNPIVMGAWGKADIEQNVDATRARSFPIVRADTTFSTIQ